LRMAITLEDIVKSSKKNALSATLKPELIEPEIEASIPCIEYIPKHLQPALTNFKLLSPIENKTKPHSTFEFSFEQMDKNCKEIEESFIQERQKNTLEEIERAIGKQFNCAVKMVRNENLNCLPKAVIIKSGENIEMFSIRAMDR